MEILNVKDISFKYPLCAEYALKSVSFSVQRGDFVVVCGSTGSGKTTLLRLLKEELMPLGEMHGEIAFASDAKKAIGFVGQHPEQQIVCDKVWHELAFGLENLGVPQNVIRRRVAEMASYFNMEDIFYNDVSTLSGGQKQLLNLASVMAMNPKVLILDEPTSQLDPISASSFISTVKKLNTDTALTIISSEHHLDEILESCNKMVLLHKGSLSSCGEPRQVLTNLTDLTLLPDMPTSAKIFHGIDAHRQCPLTIRECSKMVTESYKNDIKKLDHTESKHSSQPALEYKNVFFRYARDLPDVLKDLSLTIYEGEFFFLLGGNGGGKTTALEAAAGFNKPYCGEINVFGKNISRYKGQSLFFECIAYLPQDVQTLFTRNTVREELKNITVPFTYDISVLMDKHPYDLSGGEAQLVALAKVLSVKPRLLLLDEPTKGLDEEAKIIISKTLKEICKSGVTIFAVTHDIEFAAANGDRCGMLFGGYITSLDTPHRFFSENIFYTTSSCKITRDIYDEIITPYEAIEICKKNGKRYDSD